MLLESLQFGLSDNGDATSTGDSATINMHLTISLALANYTLAQWAAGYIGTNFRSNLTNVQQCRFHTSLFPNHRELNMAYIIPGTYYQNYKGFCHPVFGILIYLTSSRFISNTTGPPIRMRYLKSTSRGANNLPWSTMSPDNIDGRKPLGKWLFGCLVEDEHLTKRASDNEEAI